MTVISPSKLDETRAEKAELVIYVDGSKSVGLGHLTRMRTLVRKIGVPTSIFTTTPALCRQVFSATNAEVCTLVEGDLLSDVVTQNFRSARVLVLDPPYEPLSPQSCSGPAWQPEIDRLRAQGLKVVRFTDEESATAHNCDALINDHPDAASFGADYGVLGEARHVLAGARYFLIEFSPIPMADADRNVFISFGGSDQADLIDKFAPSIFELAASHRMDICLGAGKLSAGMLPDSITVYDYMEPEDFAQKMASSRLSVTASGNTLFERVAYGVPGISLAQFPRQDRIGKAFERMGLTKHLGLGSEIAPRHLIDAVTHLSADEDAMAAQVTAASELKVRSGAAEIVKLVQDLIR